MKMGLELDDKVFMSIDEAIKCADKLALKQVLSLKKDMLALLEAIKQTADLPCLMQNKQEPFRVLLKGAQDRITNDWIMTAAEDAFKEIKDGEELAKKAEKRK